MLNKSASDLTRKQVDLFMSCDEKLEDLFFGRCAPIQCQVRG